MSNRFDRQSLNSSIQLFSKLSVLTFWIAFLYLGACVSFDLERLPNITEIRILIFGYIAYGVRFYIDLIEFEELEAIGKEWGMFLSWSTTIFVFTFVYHH